jgi:DNA-binding MarR family transcriptional regulator
MENKSLISRQPDPKDRRAVRVMLTEQGRALNEPVNAAIERANKKALERLEPQESAFLKKLLEELNHGS